MKRLTTLVSAGAVLSLASTAAAEPYVDATLLRNGNFAGEVDRDEDGRDRPNDDLYPGAEHVAIANLKGNLVMFGMGSYAQDAPQLGNIVLADGSPATEYPANNVVQMFCASTRLDPTEGPVLETMKYVTNNDGNRHRNAHHQRVLPIFGGDAALVYYNYAPDEDGRTYARVFNASCEPMSDVVEVMHHENDDCDNSDTDSRAIIPRGPNTVRSVGVYGCNGNGEDDAWIGIQDITRSEDGTSYNINVVEQDIVAEQEEERTRGWVHVGPDDSFFTACLTSGNTQPPNNGVVCSGYDTETGQRLWREYVARREGEVYRTQIHISGVTDQAGNATDTAVATWERLTETRRENQKGKVELMATSLRFTRDGMDMLTEPRDDVAVTVDGTHLGMCDSLFGTEGNESWRSVLIGSSYNGNPGAISTAQTVSYNGATRSLAPDRKISLNAAIDNQWLSNIYGQNPNNQGRNFVDCIGNVPNPGYGQEGAYQSDVKSFVAVAATTRRMDSERPGIAEDKLSTELVLVPAVTAPEAPPAGDPVDESPDCDANPELSECQDDSGNDDVGDGNDTGGNDTGGDNGVGGVGGCSTSGNAGSSSLALLGLALLVGFRRRRNR